MEKSGMHPISRVDFIEYRGKTRKCLYYEIKKEDISSECTH